jgi:hypothetical protein
VQRERVKAQDALKNIHSIEELIHNVNKKAEDMEIVINGAGNSVDNARKVAQNAQVII